MNKEEEILKEENHKEKRINKLTMISLIFLGASIMVSLSFQSQSPIVALVLIPLIVGAALGFILSIFSIRLSHETTIRLIEIQTILDELKNKDNETPLTILQKRLVKGEITIDEYDELHKKLEK